MSIEALSPTEQTELQWCETQIAKGFDAFVATATALLKVRDQRLYRVQYGTFEQYAKERWNIGRSHSYRLIAAAEVVNNFPEIESERAARELTGLDRDIQQAIYTIAEEIAPKDAEDKPVISAAVLKMAREGLETELGDILQGHMRNGAGDTKPISELLHANTIENIHERIMRQKEHIRSSLEAKTRKAQENGNQREMPARPAAQVLFLLVRDFVHGIEKMNVDRSAKLHPALHNCYHLGKALIGEPQGEISVLVDDISMEGYCESCPDGNDEGKQTEVRDVALTTEIGGRYQSVRLKLCGACVMKLNRVVDVVPEAEVVAV